MRRKSVGENCIFWDLIFQLKIFVLFLTESIRSLSVYSFWMSGKSSEEKRFPSLSWDEAEQTCLSYKDTIRNVPGHLLSVQELKFFKRR